MEVKITSKAEQPLLGRTVLNGRVSFDTVTPARADVRKKIADSIKADESLVTVPMIHTDFGQKAASVTVHVYKNKKDLDMFASAVTLNRHAKSSKKKESQAEEQPAEKRAEEGEKSGKEAKKA